MTWRRPERKAFASRADDPLAFSPMITRTTYILAALFFVLEATAYGASFFQHVQEGEKSVPLGILAHQFKYFTIWSNILALVVFARITWTRRLPHDALLAALVLWLLIVMGVWHGLLGNDEPIYGLEKLSDTLFHTVNPLLLFGWWAVFAPKSDLKWKHAALWLLWPLVYVFYAVTRGMLTGFYPYFFVDLDALGWGGLFAWSGRFLVGFYVAGLAIIALGKLLNRRAPAAPEGSAPDGPQLR